MSPSRLAVIGAAAAAAIALGTWVYVDVQRELRTLAASNLRSLFDVVKVLDFGLVKSMIEPHTRDLTRALRILGTPSYMAPERIERPDSADQCSDIYSLGALGYFMLIGSGPARRRHNFLDNRADGQADLRRTASAYNAALG